MIVRVSNFPLGLRLILVAAALAACGGGAKKEPQPPPLCPVASTCAVKQFCNVSQSCRCLRSAEGDIRCGQVPSCGIKQCTKSSDCADLGPGYFCDSPGSGCCGDDKQRCIGPCVGETCPAARICNGKCCPMGAACVNGRCSVDGGAPDAPPARPDTAPPADRVVPPAVDRPAPEDRPIPDASRVPGADAGAPDGGFTAPLDPCADDPVTQESIEAAWAALAQGATKVAVSPGGCTSYERRLDGSRLVSEILTVRGMTASEFTYTATGASGRMDGDLDGFVEWEATLTGTDADLNAELRVRAPTGALVSRERRTVKGTTVHVALEENGVLVNQFDTGVEQGTNPTSLPPGEPCDEMHDKDYRRYLKTCLERTPKCFSSHGRRDIAKQMQKAGLKAQILCVSAPNSDAYASTPGWYKNGVAPQVTIKLNTALLDRVTSEDFRIATLCHEIMHNTSLGGHDPALEGSHRRGEADSVESCTTLCGYTGNSPSSPESGYFLSQKPTKCQCATCTGKKTCDPTCAGYRDCAGDLGATCPCPQNHRWYPTITECRAGCPSGLACFGYQQCYEYDRRCP